MNKILFALLVVCASSTVTWSQTNNDQRTLTTRIADLLAQMPAQNSAQLKSGMEEISSMGEQGLVNMLGMFSSKGQGNNASLEYAIGSYSGYVTQPGKEEARKASVRAYSQALQSATDKENKAFIINQLQLIGKDDAIASLQPYLTDERLCDDASKALVSINSSAANQALLKALASSTGSCRLSLVEALGNSGYKGAVSAITPLTNSDENLSKVALFALANIADPSSEAAIAAAAEKAGFVYENKNAVSAYLIYAQNLKNNGNSAQADKIAKQLLEKVKSDDQVHIRIAALNLLVDLNKEKSIPTLLDATSDKSVEFRVAALKAAKPFISPETAPMWVSKLKRSEPASQAEILRMLGETGAQTALPAVLKGLKNKNSDVKIAAIYAAGKIGGEQVLDNLFKTLKKANAEETQAVQTALLTMKGDNLVDKVAGALPSVKDHAKDELVEVLAARGAHSKLNVVYPLLKSKDDSVRKASFEALKYMVSSEDLPQLFTLLNESSADQVPALQNAIIAAVKGLGDRTQQTDLILKQMNSAQAKTPFYKVLASIGGEKALKAVVEGFKSGDDASKKAALLSLSQWSDVSAANELYLISKETNNAEFQDQAIRGYIRATAISGYPADQKVLMLKNAMSAAKTAEQKKLVLRELAKNATYPALIFAGKYMNDPAVEQDAVNAVMNIALSDKEVFHGNIVSDLLNKTIQQLKGADSDYLKESVKKHLAEMPKGEGFVPLFNGKDLTGWKGLVGNPIERAKMDSKTLAEKQAAADEEMRKGWQVVNGELVFTGHGNNIATVKKYGDFEMLVDWKIFNDGNKNGDAGIYLRGTPQVQIWDTARVDVGAQVGSGGLYNNKVHPSKPLKLADNGLDQWNNFRILMKGDRVTVYLNGELVTDNVVLENFWDRNLPIFSEEQLELQAHGSRVAYRDIYVREIPRPKPFELSATEKKEGYKVLFDGTNMYNWTGNTTDYVAEDGNMVIRPRKGSGGNLYSKDEYGDFIFRFEFQLTQGANNGLGIRTPLEGDAAYSGMELQILDNEAEIYKNLKPYQYHGSVYGVIPAKRGFLKPVGEWNYQEVVVRGNKIKVTLNGTVILDGDIKEASKNGTADGKAHPGLKRDKGHIAFLGHGSEVKFRNIRVKDLSKLKK